jgi:hypothetical protein
MNLDVARINTVTCWPSRAHFLLSAWSVRREVWRLSFVFFCACGVSVLVGQSASELVCKVFSYCKREAGAIYMRPSACLPPTHHPSFRLLL